jgi:hypothetical protein
MPTEFREWERGLTQKEKRIREVVSLMSRGAWLSGVTDELLAERWGCTPVNVRLISAEASRVIRMRLRDDPEAQKEARACLLQNIDTIRAKAMGNGDAQSLRVALDSLRAYGFYLGIEPAKKLDVTGHTTDRFEGWTTEEKERFARDNVRPERLAAGQRRALHATTSALVNGNGAGHPAEADDDATRKVH